MDEPNAINLVMEFIRNNGFKCDYGALDGWLVVKKSAKTVVLTVKDNRIGGLIDPNEPPEEYFIDLHDPDSLILLIEFLKGILP